MNIRSRLSVGLTAAMVLGLFAPAPLFAQGAGYGPGAQGNRPVGDKMHGRCDTNKDGKVTMRPTPPCRSKSRSVHSPNCRPKEEGIAFLPWHPLEAGGSARGTRALDRVAQRHDATPVQIAIAWLLARSSVMVPIPGTSSLPHLEENVAAARLKLSKDDLKELS